MTSAKFGIFTLLAAAASFLAASRSEAYFSVINTGELVAPEHYRATLEPQFIIDNYQGANIDGKFDVGIDEDSSARAVVGFGRVAYEFGGLYKYVPYPDIGKQPAIGGEVGVVMARIGNDNQISIRFNPLVSKKFDTKYGDLTPYGSLPIGITSGQADTYIPAQIVGGAELKPNGYEGIRLYSELGIELNRAFSYISLAVAYDFDDGQVHSKKSRY